MNEKLSERLPIPGLNLIGKYWVSDWYQLQQWLTELAQAVEAIDLREADYKRYVSNILGQLSEQVRDCLRALPRGGVPSVQASENGNDTESTSTCGIAEQLFERMRNLGATEVEIMAPFQDSPEEGLEEQENDRLRKRNEGLETKLLCSKGRIEEVEGQINLCNRWNIDLRKRVAELEKHLEDGDWLSMDAQTEADMQSGYNKELRERVAELETILNCAPVLNERVMQADLCARLERRVAELQAAIDAVVKVARTTVSNLTLLQAVWTLYPLATKEAAEGRCPECAEEDVDGN